MRRLHLLAISMLSAVLAVGAAACGDGSQAGGTLPPIVTTTTTTTLPPTTTTVPKRYTVKRGDRLSEICKKWGLDQQEVMRLNRISNPDHIFRGQVLKLPPPTLPPPTTTTTSTSTTVDAG